MHNSSTVTPFGLNGTQSLLVSLVTPVFTPLLDVKMAAVKKLHTPVSVFEFLISRPVFCLPACLPTGLLVRFWIKSWKPLLSSAFKSKTC